MTMSRGAELARSTPEMARIMPVIVLPATIGALLNAAFGRGELLPAIMLGYLLLVGIWLAIIDARTHRLPNAIIYPSYGVLALLLVLYGITEGDWGAVGRAAAAAAATGVVYLVFAWVGSMGMGDVKLGVLLGGALGWASWGAALAGAFLGFAIAAVVAIVLLARGRGRKAHIAFGPYLIAGALTVLTVDMVLSLT